MSQSNNYNSVVLKSERLHPQHIEWEKILWEQTPYRGVFIHKIEEELNSSNPNIPLFTVMALKLKPRAVIPLHRHNRELGWTETITLPGGSRVEIKDSRGSREINSQRSFAITIEAGEIFGLKNMSLLQSLYFVSRMEPGFTGYEEIEEVKAADFPAEAI